MLSSIANFFFGTSNSENSDLNKNCDNEESLNETFIKESDGDDWILVNHNEKLSNETQKKQLETLSKEKEKIENNKIDEKNQSFSETLSNTNNNALEESWFITPPPCFTKKFQVALSPIENILIEHPSTSVFHRHFSLFDFMKDTNAAATRLFSQYYDHKSSDKCKKEGVRGRNRNRKQKSRRETRKDVQKRDSLDSSTSKEVRNNKNGKEQKVNKKGLDVDSDILKQRHTQKQIPLVETTNLLASFQKVNEKRSQKHLKKSFMNRQNLVMYKGNFRPTRRKKLTLIQNGYSSNRKSC